LCELNKTTKYKRQHLNHISSYFYRYGSWTMYTQTSQEPPK